MFPNIATKDMKSNNTKQTNELESAPMIDAVHSSDYTDAKLNLTAA